MFLDKASLAKERSAAGDKVREWQAKLKEATDQLAYWQRYVDAVMSVQGRYLFVEDKPPISPTAANQGE